MTSSKPTEPPILPGCSVLPPIDRRDAEPATDTGTTKRAKRKGDGTTGNRFAVLNTFVDCSMRELKAADVRVWLVLCRDTRDGIAVTAQADIAERSGISVRAVHGSIRRLERLGLFKVVYRGGLNRGSSRYRVSALIGDSLRNCSS